MDKNPRATSASSPEPGRRAWTPPRLTRRRAGEAELGGNPSKPEQAFAMGS